MVPIILRPGEAEVVPCNKWYDFNHGAGKQTRYRSLACAVIHHYVEISDIKPSTPVFTTETSRAGKCPEHRLKTHTKSTR